MKKQFIMVRIILLNGRNMVMEKFIMIMVLDFTVQKTKIWPKNEVSVRIKNGYANRYEIECDGLKVLNLNMRDYTMLHWLTILLENREFDASTPLAAEAKRIFATKFHLDYEKADIIIGYRADDSYFSFAADFINGAISYRQLSNAMRLGKLGQQFV